MTPIRKFVAVAAASAGLGLFALGASPALAQGWYGDNGPPPGPSWGPPGPYGPNAYNAWDEGYAPPYGGYGVVIQNIPICPGGYHLGRSGRLCWPD